MEGLDFRTSPYSIKRRAFFFYSFIFLVILINPLSALAYTYSDVEDFMSSHPAPSGCIDYLEEVTGGYRIIRRCNGSGVRSMWYEFYAKGIHNTDWWSNQVIVCGAESGRTLTNNFYSYYTESVHRTIYCDGRIDDQYDILSRGYINEFGTDDPCVSPIRYYSNCKNLDSVLSAFVPVEKCFNPLRGAYESCAQNCKDPVYKTEITEVCGDNIDNNCNGGRDEGCAQCVDADSDDSFAYDAITCPEGNDCDDNDASKNHKDDDHDGISTCNGDCDDEDTSTNPGVERDGCDDKDNNCNTDVDEDCCEVDTVTVEPAWVWPKKTDGYTSAEISVNLFRPAPPEGCTVNLTVEPVDESGGHKHDGDRLTGTLDENTLPFYYAETGPKSVTYTSGEVSGEEKIKATIVDGRGDEAEIVVKVPGLQPFPGSGYYHIVVRAGTGTHPEGTHGMEMTIRMLEEVTQKYFELTNRKLSINDLSLPEGGLFDINNNWTTPHIEHRAGTDADINRTDGGGVFTNCEDDIPLTEAVGDIGKGGIPTLQCESSGRKHIDFD